MIAKTVTLPIKGLVTKWNRFVMGHRVPSEFNPKVRIFQQKGRFVLKSVETADELESVLRLRYEVFDREYKKKRNPFGYDVDQYDAICDHLLIRDEESGAVVGTYRLISSEFSEKFYSQSEFVLDDFLAQPGVKLELGRACIDKMYRNGVVIGLLWRGISEYIQAVGATYLFGCASVKTTDVKETAHIVNYLNKNNLLEESYGIEPTGIYTMSGLNEMIVSGEFESQACDPTKLIPALFRSYLRAGAKIHGLPAVDHEFHCVDFLAILRVGQLTESFDRKYRVC